MSNDLISGKMRLIDLDKNEQKELAELLEEAAEEIQNLYGYDTDLSERLYCKVNEIEQVETAYDVDKVVEQIQNVHLPLASQTARIASIVKRGGVNDNH